MSGPAISRSGSPLRVGVIGCGYAADVHLPAIVSLPDARVVALADSDPTRLARQADRWGVTRRIADWRELVVDEEIDAVAVLTPPYLHFEMTRDLMRAGKHVYVEKPIAVGLADADELIRTADETGVVVTVGYNLRFHRQVQQLRDLVQRGVLGEVELLRGVATGPSGLTPAFPEYRKERRFGGGVVIELAVHYYDLWEYVLGSRLVSVTTTSRSCNGDDATAVVSGRTADGILVSSEFSYRATGQHEVEVYGHRARAIATLYRYDGLRIFDRGTFGGNLTLRLRHLLAAVTGIPGAVRCHRNGGVFLETFSEHWRHFIDCIREGRNPQPDLEDGRRSLQIALAAVRSADNGSTVELDLP